MKPHQYEPFIDKIFQFAQKYGFKVFPEMHGAPGSQNGEIHRQEPSFICFWITLSFPQHAFFRENEVNRSAFANHIITLFLIEISR